MKKKSILIACMCAMCALVGCMTFISCNNDFDGVDLDSEKTLENKFNLKLISKSSIPEGITPIL